MNYVNLAAGDCLALMAKCPERVFDVVVTSPPYNLGVKYRSYKDNKSIPEYLAWADEWLGAIKRVLKDNGSFFLNFAGKPTKPLLPYLMVPAAGNHFVQQNTFHWIKSITVEKPDSEPISVGHFKPLGSERFVNDCHEFVFHFTKNGDVPLDRLAVGVPYADKSNIKRWKGEQKGDVRCRGNAIFIPYDTIQKKREHNATFPPRLVEYFLKLHGNVSQQVVLDPFMGVGNALRAGLKLGVEHFVGMEVDEVDVRTVAQEVGGLDAVKYEKSPATIYRYSYQADEFEFPVSRSV